MWKYSIVLLSILCAITVVTTNAWGFSIPAVPQEFSEAPVSNTLLVIFAEESDVFGNPGQPGPVEPPPNPGIPGGPGGPGPNPEPPPAVPEPGTIVLFGLGLLGMAVWLRRKRV